MIYQGQNVYIWQDGNDTMMDYGSGTVRFTNTTPEDLRFSPETTMTAGGGLSGMTITSKPMAEHVSFIYAAPPEGESTAELQAAGQANPDSIVTIGSHEEVASGEDRVSDDTLIKA